jgi:hypothetical protein
LPGWASSGIVASLSIIVCSGAPGFRTRASMIILSTGLVGVST